MIESKISNGETYAIMSTFDVDQLKTLNKMLIKSKELLYENIEEDQEFEDFKILEDFVEEMGEYVEQLN